MITSPLIPGAADSAASDDAAFPASITPTPGVRETPDDLPDATALDATRRCGSNALQDDGAPEETALQTRDVAQPVGVVLPTVVQARPVVPPPALPQALGLSDRQRRALAALAGGMGPHAAAEIAGVSPVTLFRWRKFHPKFIAAYNAWKAESLRTAQEYLAAANEQAARTILRAVQAGDVRASLAVLRGLGALVPQKIGPAYAPIVEQDIVRELQAGRSAFGARSRPDEAWSTPAGGWRKNNRPKPKPDRPACVRLAGRNSNVNILRFPRLPGRSRGMPSRERAFSAGPRRSSSLPRVAR